MNLLKRGNKVVEKETARPVAIIGARTFDVFVYDWEGTLIRRMVEYADINGEALRLCQKGRRFPLGSVYVVIQDEKVAIRYGLHTKMVNVTALRSGYPKNNCPPFADEAEYLKGRWS